MSFDGFTDATEAQITRAISDSWVEELRECTDTEAIVVGGGPSGFVTVREPAECSVDVTIVERNNYLGGGLQLGDFLMNKVAVCDPVQRILDELGVPYEESDEIKGLYAADGPHAYSALIKAVYDVDVRIQNMTESTDVVLRKDDRVGGIVMNRTLACTLPRELTCVDPIAVESDLVLDVTGHDAVVLSRLSERGVLDVNSIEHARGHNVGMDKTADSEYGAPGHDSPGHDSMWVSESEDNIMDATGVVYSGVVASGTAVVMAHHPPRMGSAFGVMLFSRRQAARSCLDEFGRDVPDVSISGSVPADD